MPVDAGRRYAALVVAGFGVLLLLAGVGVVTVWLVATPAVAALPVPVGSRSLRSEGTRVDLFAGGGEVRYRSLEVLAGRGANEAVGRTGDLSGSIVFDAAGDVLADQSTVTVDLRTLQSDNAMRDRYIQRNTLQTGQFPTATFVLTAAPGLPLPLPTSGTATFELIGDLTIHGVTRAATWQATATFADGEVIGSAMTTVLLTEFGMEPPKAGPVLSIEDAVRLELDVRGVIAPSLADLVTDPT